MCICALIAGGLILAACASVTPSPTSTLSPTILPTSTVAPTATPPPPDPPPLPPVILHKLNRREECLACHTLTAVGSPALPADHAQRSQVVCLGCHALAPGLEADVKATQETSDE
ncbi:MAG: hypothetical protein BMS9Abin28_1742 [Anaerolineae bacterium]|nr:MAG: hypothetical protein BMS9Abin28_1742 [Anaerolineae bacterium]